MSTNEALNVKNYIGESGDYGKNGNGEEKFFMVTISGETFCISLNAVSEFLVLKRIIEVADMPKNVKGVINLRGKIIPVIDMREELGQMTQNMSVWNLVVVINVRGNLMGLAVDNFQEIISLSDMERKSLPRFKEVDIINSSEHRKIILDAERFMEEKDIKKINENIEECIRPALRA